MVNFLFCQGMAFTKQNLKPNNLPFAIIILLRKIILMEKEEH